MNPYVVSLRNVSVTDALSRAQSLYSCFFPFTYPSPSSVIVALRSSQTRPEWRDYDSPACDFSLRGLGLCRICEYKYSFQSRLLEVS